MQHEPFKMLALKANLCFILLGQSPHPCRKIRDLHVSVKWHRSVKGRSDFSHADSFSQTMRKGRVWPQFACVWMNVCFCLYLAVQFFHSDQVQGLEGVSCRGNEIKADVDPGVVVVKQRALDLQLFLEIVFELSVDVVDDGLVTVETAEEKLWEFMSVVRSINICLLIHAFVINIKGSMASSLGKWSETVMFSVTVRSDSVPRSRLRAVQLTATWNLFSAYRSTVETNQRLQNVLFSLAVLW